MHNLQVSQSFSKNAKNVDLNLFLSKYKYIYSNTFIFNTRNILLCVAPLVFRRFNRIRKLAVRSQKLYRNFNDC